MPAFSVGDPKGTHGFSSFSFLGGSRRQRLQLLFYILLPPELLHSFLERHPGGGVPLWLLEVGNETVLSLASLSHYYWYGDIITPFKENNNIIQKQQQQQPPHLLLDGKEVFEFFKSILIAKDSSSSPDGDASHNNNINNTNSVGDTKNPSPIRKSSSSIKLRRRASHQSNTEQEGSMNTDSTAQTDVMDRILLQSTFALKDYLPDEKASRDRFLSAAPLPEKANMTDFYAWTNWALDDSALDAIMHRLFAHTILPNPSVELELVRARWREWQETECVMWSKSLEPEGALEMITHSVRKILSMQNGGGEGSSDSNHYKTFRRKAFGGIGGFDGRGGTGYGVMHCVDKKWWSAWEAYVGWSWAGDNTMPPPRQKNGTIQRYRRPGDLSTEHLLDRSDDEIVAGTFGSYELMKRNLGKDSDYVLIPSAVWDILYELYGGGPPLLRMVLPPEAPSIQVAGINNGGIETELRIAPSEIDLDAMASTDNADRVLRIPHQMNVETHPWILHFHLCDPQQPYRRGDAGPVSISVMALPDQPLWRLYAEIVVRLPFNIFRAYGPNGRGKARLWKRTDPAGPKDAMSRYGPWTLLCKNRYALLPALSVEEEQGEQYKVLKENWQLYADNASVESIGLTDTDQIMVECAVLNRTGGFMWPREAAAKAGRVRRLADKDMKFRRMLRGLDDHGKPMSNPKDLVGMTVDAMDASGRWYQVVIAQVQTVVADTDEEEDSIEMESPDGFGSHPNHYADRRKDSGEHKQVRVDFSEHGGHSEWIDVDSDRLASAGRFTLGTSDDFPDTPPKSATSGSNGNDGKMKTQTQVKKTATEAVPENNGKVCTIPGYGACGLANLGNTCYVNSAIQCISYLPLLRAYLLSAQYKATGDLNKDNPLGTGGKLLEEFAELLRQMWSAKIGEKSPTRFRAQLGKANAQFSGADQQDAQEFLNYMLDVLHEDSNRVRKKPYVEGLEDEWVKKTSLPRVGEEAWRR